MRHDQAKRTTGRHSDIQITEEMIAAGVSALWLCLPEGENSVTVEEVYIAMWRAAHSRRQGLPRVAADSRHAAPPDE